LITGGIDLPEYGNSSVISRVPGGRHHVEPTQRSIVVVDVGGLAEPDPAILDALVRFQLTAQRLGASIRLENACPVLVDLLALAGLSDVLPVICASGVEMDRQTKEREKGRVDEEVEPGDAPA
jgi:ABC-type transporter Mla MlaB component